MDFCASTCRPTKCWRPNDRAGTSAAILAEQGLELKPVFISVDPARDTPEVLREFTDNFNPDMIGLTGTPEDIAAVTHAYRTFYAAQEDDPEYYLVDHSTFSFLMLPDYGFVDLVSRQKS
ncbi:MAG: SCO family protein [Boseongicola sp.]